MTRAPSSSPSWYPVHDDRPEPDRVHTWRRLGGDAALVRAKTIPRGEIPTPTHSSLGNTGNIRNVVAINRHSEVPSFRKQSLPRVQRTASALETDVLDVIDTYGVASARVIAEDLECTEWDIQRRGGELHTLQRDGFIESVRGRSGGYRRVTR